MWAREEVKWEMALPTLPFLLEGMEVPDPGDVLNLEKCLQSLAALRHAKWFQVRGSRIGRGVTHVCPVGCALSHLLG